MLERIRGPQRQKSMSPGPSKRVGQYTQTWKCQGMKSEEICSLKSERALWKDNVFVSEIHLKPRLKQISGNLCPQHRIYSFLTILLLSKHSKNHPRLCLKERDAWWVWMGWIPHYCNLWSLPRKFSIFFLGILVASQNSMLCFPIITLGNAHLYEFNPFPLHYRPK